MGVREGPGRAASRRARSHHRVLKVTFLARSSHTVWGRVRSLYYVKTVNRSFNFLLQEGGVQCTCIVFFSSKCSILFLMFHYPVQALGPVPAAPPVGLRWAPLSFDWWMLRRHGRHCHRSRLWQHPAYFKVFLESRPLRGCFRVKPLCFGVRGPCADVCWVWRAPSGVHLCHHFDTSGALGRGKGRMSCTVVAAGLSRGSCARVSVGRRLEGPWSGTAPPRRSCASLVLAKPKPQRARLLAGDSW